MRRAAASAGGARGVFGMGRSRAKRYDANAVETRITFEDVAGIDEVENELVEVVDLPEESRPSIRASAGRCRRVFC